MATQKQVAEHLDLSVPRIKQLLQEGLIPSEGPRKPLDLDRCRVAYIRYLREFANGTAQPSPNEIEAEPGTMDYERLRLTRAQADGQEIKNEIARGKTAPVEIISLVLSRIAGEASGELDSLPLNIKRRHPELNNQIIESIKRHVVKAQNAIARTGDSLEHHLDDYLADQDAA